MDEQPLTRRARRDLERAQHQGSPQPSTPQPPPVPAQPATPNPSAPYPSRPVIRPAVPNATQDSPHPHYVDPHSTQAMPRLSVPANPLAQGPQPYAPAGAYFDNPAQYVDQPPQPSAPQRTREPIGIIRGTIRTFGELCITAGLVLILFVGWQLWWTDFEADRDNEHLATELVHEWSANPRNDLPDDPDNPYVAQPVNTNTAFAIMYIPRFGDDYYRTIAEGVSLEPVLNRMGLGRYPTSAMPGEVGNFAMAGHRVTYGKPLNQIHQMRPGDELIVQTADGFYTYEMRNFEIVLPDATDVLAPVPAMPEYKGKDRLLTLTACNPMFSARERYVIYAELSNWRPATEGAPDSISDSAAYVKNSGGV